MKIIKLITYAIIACGFTFSMQGCSKNDSVVDPQPIKGDTGSTIEELVNRFWDETSYLKLDQKRLSTMDEMQRWADLCTNVYFNQYYACEDSTLCAHMEEGSILYYHKKSLDRLLEMVPKEKVPEGKVVLWQLYNMGYIVKTSKHCFGIDIKHKYAAKLEPLLEFLLITHAHEDHYTTALINKMTEACKPVYSNFIDNKYKITGKSVINVIDDIQMEVNIVDHNATLPNFVVTYQIDCGKDANHCIIFHTGDAYNVDQLNPTKAVDIMIPHLAVGLDMKEVVSKIQPKMLLLSHILELGHPVEKWRWSYQYGVKCCTDLQYDKAYLPVWGEKITY